MRLYLSRFSFTSCVVGLILLPGSQASGCWHDAAQYCLWRGLGTTVGYHTACWPKDPPRAHRVSANLDLLGRLSTAPAIPASCGRVVIDFTIRLPDTPTTSPVPPGRLLVGRIFRLLYQTHPRAKTLGSPSSPVASTKSGLGRKPPSCLLDRAHPAIRRGTSASSDRLSSVRAGWQTHRHD